MKRLSECKKGCTAVISRVNASGALKQRLISFGVMKGSTVTMMGCSATKSTVEIKVGKMQIALRREEADLIEVDA